MRANCRRHQGSGDTAGASILLLQKDLVLKNLRQICGDLFLSRTKGRRCFEAFALYLHPKNFQNEFHRSDYRRSRILDDRGIPPDSNQSRIPLRHEMLVGFSPRWVVRLRGLAADQPLHIVNPARGLRVLLLLEHTGSLSAEETGGERVVPGKSQTQEIARPSFDGTETPSVPGTPTVPN